MTPSAARLASGVRIKASTAPFPAKSPITVASIPRTPFTRMPSAGRSACGDRTRVSMTPSRGRSPITAANGPAIRAIPTPSAERSACGTWTWPPRALRPSPAKSAFTTTCPEVRRNRHGHKKAQKAQRNHARAFPQLPTQRRLLPAYGFDLRKGFSHGAKRLECAELAPAFHRCGSPEKRRPAGRTPNAGATGWAPGTAGRF